MRTAIGTEIWDIQFKASVGPSEARKPFGSTTSAVVGFPGVLSDSRGLSGDACLSKSVKSGQKLIDDMEKALAKLEGATKKAFISDVVAMAGSDEIGKALKALGRGATQEALQQVARMSYDFTSLEASLKKSVTTAIEITNQSMIGGTQDSFHVTNELAVKAAAKAGRGIPKLSSTARQTIREAIADNVNYGLGIEETAARIQNSLGLDKRLQTAVDNYRNTLLKSGKKRTVVNRLVKTYTARLTNQRAVMVARTETAQAANVGQREYWLDMMNQGYLTHEKTYKEWVTAADERTCPMCGPMDGVRVKLDELFQVDSVMLEGPIVHPNCRCSLTLFIEE